MRAEVTLLSPKPIKCKRNSTGDKNLRCFSLQDVPGYLITNKRDLVSSGALPTNVNTIISVNKKKKHFPSVGCGQKEMELKKIIQRQMRTTRQLEVSFFRFQNSR